MSWFRRPDFSNEFRLIIAGGATGTHEYVLAAPNEHEAFEAAVNVTKSICGDARVSVSAFLLDAHGVFLGDISEGQPNTEMVR